MWQQLLIGLTLIPVGVAGAALVFGLAWMAFHRESEQPPDVS